MIKKIIEIDIEKMLNGAAKEDAESQFYLGTYFDSKGNKQLSYEWFCKAADQGYALAICAKAACIYHGYGVKQDKSKAFVIFESVANSCPESKYYLSFKYDNTEPDKSMKLLEEAANDGEVDAMVKLAHIYQRNVLLLGQRHDSQNALKWYKKVYNLGFDEIALEISELYKLLGDHKQHYRWLQIFQKKKRQS